MKIIPASEYHKFTNCAKSISFCTVFPLSITEGRQSEHIYQTANNTLIRHKNNFTFIFGTPDKDEIQEIHDLIIAEKLKFMCDDITLAKDIFSLGGLEFIPRDVYKYLSDTAPAVDLPEGYSLRTIDRELFSMIKGDVPPTLYWDDFEQYSKNGMGRCVMFGSEPAAWAFSSAVSSDECDIGIETVSAHRKRGVALAAAAAMVNDILPDKRPTWICHRSNIGSARTAERLGFTKLGECFLLRCSG